MPPVPSTASTVPPQFSARAANAATPAGSDARRPATAAGDQPRQGHAEQRASGTAPGGPGAGEHDPGGEQRPGRGERRRRAGEHQPAAARGPPSRTRSAAPTIQGSAAHATSSAHWPISSRSAR